jgi:carbamoyltransferase
MAIVIGINCGHDGSASLVCNGKLKGYIATERLTRIKKCRGITTEAIDYLLKKANLTIDNVDAIAVANWFSDCNDLGKDLWDKEQAGFNISWRCGKSYIIEDDILFNSQHWNDIKGYDSSVPKESQLYLNWNGISKPCYIVKHHFAHTAAVFFLSPFTESLSFSLDFSDRYGACFSLYHFSLDSPRGAKITSGDRLSIGALYSMICDYLGFFPSLEGAGKIMALAAYGEADFNEIADFCYPNDEKLIKMFGRELYYPFLIKLGVKSLPSLQLFYPQLKGEGGTVDPCWRKKDEAFSPLSLKLAANIQLLLERYVASYLVDLKQQLPELASNICFSGGVFLNSVMNEQLYNSKIFSEIFIAPPCGDDGLSIGAAFSIEHFLNSLNGFKRDKIQHTARECFEGGYSYSNSEIIWALENIGQKEKIFFRSYEENDLLNLVVNELDKGKIIGWFEGGSEIGPRALGHRSIIADARDVKIKNQLNLHVKKREAFRPFGPVVLSECKSDWFQLNSDSPFMLRAVNCLKPHLIPSGVHIDNSARVQTVDEKNNGRYYLLLKKFYEKTGVPILINTSFNINGEPIVENPKDALICFLNSELDLLVIGDFIVTKQCRLK